jgi:hypothetical protein
VQREIQVFGHAKRKRTRELRREEENAMRDNFTNSKFNLMLQG